MPELPEVETICNGLKHLISKKVKNVFRSQKRLRIDSTLDLLKLQDSKIKNFNRRARYMIIDFDNNYSLIVHLGMSGKVTHSNDLHYITKKHDHFIINFDDDSRFIFNDPRRFGFIDLVYTKNLTGHKMLANLGPEPLTDIFNEKYLSAKLQKKNMNIKTAMMDNKIVVGVGNIYINESLFAAKISPLRLASSLNKKEIERLVKVIKKTLQTAIELGGSSINDYVDAKGNKGNFQNNFKVYGNHQKNCTFCSALIEKTLQNGRSTFFCKTCQT